MRARAARAKRTAAELKERWRTLKCVTLSPSRSAASRRAPGLLRVLRETDLEHVLLDGTLAECDRSVTAGRTSPRKNRRHGVNVQVVADPAGKLLWISPALPGRTHDLTVTLHPPHHPDL